MTWKAGGNGVVSALATSLSSATEISTREECGNVRGRRERARREKREREQRQQVQQCFRWAYTPFGHEGPAQITFFCLGGVGGSRPRAGQPLKRVICADPSCPRGVHHADEAIAAITLARAHGTAHESLQCTATSSSFSLLHAFLAHVPVPHPPRATQRR